MKLKNLKKWGALAASACMALSASAITLDVGLTDPYAVGDVVPGVDYGSYGGQAQGDLAMINQLVGMQSPGSALVTAGKSKDSYLYNRSANFATGLQAATL